MGDIDRAELEVLRRLARAFGRKRQCEQEIKELRENGTLVIPMDAEVRAVVANTEMVNVLAEWEASYDAGKELDTPTLPAGTLVAGEPLRLKLKGIVEQPFKIAGRLGDDDENRT